MLSRKYYKMIAKVIKDNTYCSLVPAKQGDLDKVQLINDLCAEFKADNSLFSADRFVDACD